MIKAIYLYKGKMVQTMENFGRRIKELREERKLTQQQLAKELNIDKSTVAKYETNSISPSCQMLIIFAKYFSVSTDYLLGLED